MNNKAIYIIPARGGSKGIPGKNIKKLHGKPLICYSIDVARQLAPDSRIILSTEDPEIADVARNYGLPVNYTRPPQFATDTAGSREVILDAMRWADEQSVDYDRVVLLQPTSPLRTADDVARCEQLYTPEVDMVVTVTEARSNPYYNCFETDPATGHLRISKGDGLLTRRQDAPPAWEFNGAVYVINPNSIREMPMGSFTRRIPVVMPPERSLDLDTPIDWAVMEMILNDTSAKHC
ncbi:MAG: acylneuraminate cytidylyltransferase family protein [Muribaculaceae bacterium]|nr:acylneuraminate cytidylyltransferase family protein [Muribaculaceae bacterium]